MIGKLESPQALQQDAGESASFALSGWSTLAIQGPDALAFAQLQLMNDVGRLTDGTWQWSGWLSPKGRVIALCLALRLDPETLWLLLPDMPAGDLAGALQRFVFRSKVKIIAMDHWRFAGRFIDSTEPPDCNARIKPDGSTILHFGTADGDVARQRRLQLFAGSAPGPLPEPDDLAEWLACDLRAGLPHLDGTQSEQFTPQMLALDRLRAFSVKKGCYPGQEVVSRTHFLGKAKRRLCRLALAPDVAAGVGTNVSDAESRVISSLLNVVHTPAGIEALCILDENSSPHVAGQPARRVPLLDLLPH